MIEEVKGKDKIRLRAVNELDSGVLSKILNDLNIVQYLEGLPLPCDDTAAEENIRRIRGQGNATFAIDIFREEGFETIGFCQLYRIDCKNCNADIGIAITKNYQKIGYGLLALEVLINYAFNILNLRRINASSCVKSLSEILMALGFQKEGALRQKVYADGQYRDECVFGLLKEEWKRLRSGL